MKILGPLYFVGTKGLGSWLFATTEGLILLNTGMPSSGPMIEASIRKLGFSPDDIKILLTGHAHIDHAGGHAYIKQLFGAKVAAMDEEVQNLESGGESDFFYGRDVDVMGFAPAYVDRVLRDGDQVKLGDVVLTALHTPGHTQGATTWTTTIVDGGKAYTIAFPDGGRINPGYRLADKPSYPGIEADYRNTLHRLEMLKPDIWFSSHLEKMDFDGKRERATTEGVSAWVDPEGYRKFVATQRRAFEDQMDKEMAPARKSAAGQ